MKKRFLILTLLWNIATANAQTEATSLPHGTTDQEIPINKEDDSVFTIVEEAPAYGDGSRDAPLLHII